MSLREERHLMFYAETISAENISRSLHPRILMRVPKWLGSQVKNQRYKMNTVISYRKVSVFCLLILNFW